jgi:hypothetical protein
VTFILVLFNSHNDFTLEVDYSTSQKLEIKSDDDDDPNLAAIIRGS